MIGNRLCISADSHLEDALDVWSSYLPEKYRDYGPRRVRLSHGGDGFLVEGQAMFYGGMSFFAGRPPEEFRPLDGVTWGISETPAAEGNPPGTRGPKQRVVEQDADGLDAEIIFPSPGGRRVLSGIREDNAYFAMITAYNRYLGEEYCAVAPDRLLATGVIPERGIDAALAELERCKQLGLNSINLSRFPSGKTYPTAEDDRFWAAALEMVMPVTIHVGFDHERSQPVLPYSKYPESGRPQIDPIDRLYRYGVRGAMNVIQLVMSGVFDRFPDLQVYFAENQIGWVPTFLEQADHNYKRHHFWAESVYDWPKLTKLPSEYIREHVSWGFFSDHFGVQSRHAVGIDKIMWGSDFPHAESDWPNSGAALDEHFVGIPDDERYKLVASNAIDFFHLEKWAAEK